MLCLIPGTGHFKCRNAARLTTASIFTVEETNAQRGYFRCFVAKQLQRAGNAILIPLPTIPGPTLYPLRSGGLSKSAPKGDETK